MRESSSDINNEWKEEYNAIGWVTNVLKFKDMFDISEVRIEEH